MGEDSGIPQRLHNIIAFKVGIIREQFIYAHTRANLPDDHADSYPHTANTWLAPHNGGVLSYPVKVFFVHKASILRKQAKNKGVGAGTPDTVACIDIAKQTKPKRSMNMKKTIVIALVLILLASCAKKETPNKDDFVMDGTVLVNYRGNAAKVTIPKGVTAIGNLAFDRCNSVTSVTIPKGVTSIGNLAFSSCINLTSVKIPSSVTFIGAAAFAYCDNLTSITIPKGVTAIESETFLFCTNLTSIKLPASITSIGKDAFIGCGLTAIKIPPSVTFIGDFAFYNCTKLRSVTIPSSVTSVGDGAFFYEVDIVRGNLETVTVSRKTIIGEYAFPDGVTVTYSD